MSDGKYLFERAKKAALAAINAERNGNLSAAFDNFLLAAEIINKLIKLEKSQAVRDSYYSKAKEYINRAKEIKTIMNAKQSSADLDLPSHDMKSDLPPPPKTTPKEHKDRSPPPPPPPKDADFPPPPPKDQKNSSIPPPPPPPKDSDSKPPTNDITKKMMRGEDSESPKPKSPPSQKNSQEKPERKKPKSISKAEVPTKTTFELLYDQGRYRECIIECTKSVEAELRVRMGLFDEQLTLGMLIDQAIRKGFEVLKEFKFVNILANRIEHERYRPTEKETKKAVLITTKILLS